MPGLSPIPPDAIDFVSSRIPLYDKTPYAQHMQEAVDLAKKGQPDVLRDVLGNEMHKLEVDIQIGADAQKQKDLEQLKKLRETFAFEFNPDIPKPGEKEVVKMMGINSRNFSLFSNLGWTSIFHPVAAVKQIVRNMGIKKDIRTGAI